MIARKGILLMLFVGGPAFAAWQYRDYVRTHWLAALTEPKASSVVVYTWTDASGTLHYEQRPGKQGRAIVVDTSRITRLEALKEPPKPAQPAGSQTLRDLRRENERDQMKMREKMLEQAME